MKQLQGEQSGAGEAERCSNCGHLISDDVCCAVCMDRKHPPQSSHPVQSVKQGQAEEWVKHQQEQYGDASPVPSDAVEFAEFLREYCDTVTDDEGNFYWEIMPPNEEIKGTFTSLEVYEYWKVVFKEQTPKQ